MIWYLWHVWVNEIASYLFLTQETQSKYEKSVQLIKLLKDEIEDLKRNCNELKSKQSDAKAINDAHLLEEKARLIMEKQSLEEKTAGYKNALKEFEMVKTRHTQLVEENSSLLSKVIHIQKKIQFPEYPYCIYGSILAFSQLQVIQKERSEQEDNINQLKEQVCQQRDSLIQAQTKLAEMDGVQTQLE